MVARIETDVVRSRTAFAFVAGVVAMLFMLLVWHGRSTAFDNYVYLADAWRHGHNWIAFPGDFIDAMPFHGRAYIIEAPMPAVLLFPAVLIFGTHANQTLLANVLGAVGVFAAWRLCENVGLPRAAVVAATAFMFFGTSFFVCSTVGTVWFLGHAAATAFTLLAIAECLGRRRAWLVSTWALGAAFSRYPMFAAMPFYGIAVLSRRRFRATLESFFTPIVPALVVWVLYNYSRWKTFSDPAFTLFYRIMDADHLRNPATFSSGYVPKQLQAFFLTPPRLSLAPPFVAPPYFGYSITFTSAPFLYAIFAGATLDALVLWGATVVTAVPAFAYYGTGDGQYGMRHALDFEPFLFGLLALAMKRRPWKVVTIALALFAAFGAYEGLLWLLAPDTTR